MRSEQSSSFEDGEGLFDGVEVWGVSGQEQQVMACFFSDGAEFFLRVEGCIVHDDDAGPGKFWQ